MTIRPAPMMYSGYIFYTYEALYFHFHYACTMHNETGSITYNAMETNALPMSVFPADYVHLAFAFQQGDFCAINKYIKVVENLLHA